MKEIERTNAVIVHPNQWIEFVSQQDLYVIEVDHRNKNCYNCKGFGHLARNCRNRETGDRIGKERRLEYENRNNRQRKMIEGENKQDNNLNRKQDLILLD